MTSTSPVQRYVEAKAAVAEHARRQGTPDYDPRAHQAAIERERRARRAMERELASRKSA